MYHGSVLVAFEDEFSWVQMCCLIEANPLLNTESMIIKAGIESKI